MSSDCLPAEFIDRLREVVPDSAFADVLGALSQPSPTLFRCNTLRGEESEILAELAAEDMSATPLALALPLRAFQVPHRQRHALTTSAALTAGKIYIQNPSSMLAVQALNPKPGEEILDLAAAPGGKTLLIACLLANRGRIAAVESVRSRFFKLRANLATHGATCVQTYLKDGAAVWRHCPERFDRVLLDAPCSSEARMRSYDRASQTHWSPRKVREAARKQKRLLYSAIQSLKPGGVLVYATCAFSVEENEAAVNHLLARFPDALRVDRLGEIPAATTRGLTHWKGKELHPSLEHALRILPGGVMSGMFLCRILKTASTTSPHP
jgi:16S rRNA (cytosine1407-C5)-methyltransferase